MTDIDPEAYWSAMRERGRLMSGGREDRLKFEGLEFPELERVDELVAAADTDTVVLLRQLAESAPDEELLGAFAAGPVYALIYEHADACIEQIAEAVRQSPPFRSAVQSEVRFGGYDDLSKKAQHRLRPLLEARSHRQGHGDRDVELSYRDRRHRPG